MFIINSLIDNKDSDDKTNEKSEDKFNLSYIFYLDNKENTIELNSKDLKTLNEKVYLNDNIMNFYLKFIEQEIVNHVIKEKTYFFSTYFYSLLEQNYSHHGYYMGYLDNLKSYEYVRKV